MEIMEDSEDFEGLWVREDFEGLWVREDFEGLWVRVAAVAETDDVVVV